MMTDRFQTVLARVNIGAELMKVICNHNNAVRYPTLGEQRHRKAEVLAGTDGLVLIKNPALVNAPVDKKAVHCLRLGDILAAALSAANDADRVGVSVHNLLCRDKPVREH